MTPVQSWKKALETDLEHIAVEFKDNLDTPCVVILSGPVGAGKTTFLKKFSQLVTQETTVSPTYSLINENKNILHADFYRLKSVDDVTELELPMYLEDKEYFFIEWGDSYLVPLKKVVPDGYKYYEFKIELSENTDGVVLRNYYLNKID